MEMINGSDNAVVDNENRLQWEESAPTRPLDIPGPNSPSTCSPASSSPASPSPASPSPASSSPASSSPAISSATPAGVATTSRGPKKRKAGDDFKQQILAEHILLREQLVASRQRVRAKRETHANARKVF
nr:ejaculatory bulb-specific protein 1-like [Dermacentor andersoni]